MNLSLGEISQALGGGALSVGHVVVPGPGRSATDRSLLIRLSPTAPDGFELESLAGKDIEACRDYVRRRVGLTRFASKANGEPATREGDAAAPDGLIAPADKHAASMAYIARRKYVLETFSAISFDANEEWLVKKILPRQGVAALYGRFGSYKSFVAADIAFSVASGKEWAGHRDGAGARRVFAESDRHPDKMVERIRARIRGGEIIQSIGRGRGVNRTSETPLEVLVLGDVILPIAVDQFLPDEALNPLPIDLMLAEGGVAFESGASAAIAYPTLWPTRSAAKKALQRANRGTFCYKSARLRKSPLVRFQRVGPKLHVERAVFDPRQVRHPRGAIEAMLGPLAKFQIAKGAAAPVPERVKPERRRDAVVGFNSAA